MRKIILVFISMLLFSNPILFAQNRTDDKGRKQGAWTKTYPNRALMYEGAFEDDKPVGLFKHYYESGKLKIEQNHFPEDISEVKMYEIDGKTLAATGRYKGRQKEGEWKYYSNNSLILTENFKDGKKEGISNVYSRGRIIEQIPYKDDKITGIRRHFLEDGALYSEISYKNDLEDGAYKLFEGNEKPVAEGQHKAGKRDGDWKFYDEDGKLTETLKYKDGVQLNKKEQKEEHGRTFDKREKQKGKFREPDTQRF